MPQTVEAFGMRGEQIAAARQPLLQLLDDALLDGAIEVDEHVAAEDEVEMAAPRRGLQEIELTEIDHAPNGLGHADHSWLCGQLVEVLEDEMPRNAVHAFGFVSAGGSFRQRL